MALLVWNAPWLQDEEDTSKALCQFMHIRPGQLTDWTLVKRSLDARQKRPTWRGVYRIEVNNEPHVLSRVKSSREWTSRDGARYGLDVDGPQKQTSWPTGFRPIIVGAGPAGLFAALYFAEAGASVLLLDRGQATEERVKTVSGFWRGRLDLNPESNVVFGEGGAGTFSDGKIYTRRRDGELGFIFRRLVDLGADSQILSEAYAHLGTDKVREILPVFRARLIELGTDVRFNARVEDIIVDNGRAVGVVMADGEEIRGGPVIVATGHSARDAAEMMIRAGATAEPRAIAVGARIEHPQAFIDQDRYGSERAALPPASYRLAYNPSHGGRTAHTFCMCPGGVVVLATNHPGRMVVNGMSFAGRGSPYANSAVIVSVDPTDYLSVGGDLEDPMIGFRWQDEIEKRCFDLAGGYQAPAQLVVDLIENRPSHEVPKTSFPRGVVPTTLEGLLPDAILSGMVDAIRHFDHRMPGFIHLDGVLIAPETRTTSPIRFHRNDDGSSTSVKDLYPAGEGAGYAGGIVSSALDGLRIARAIVGV